MPRNIVKILEKNFGDMKAGEKMLISSPEVISSYISRIPVGTTITPKEMRHALAKEKGADNTCPVTTGIFLRIAIEEVLEKEEYRTGDLGGKANTISCGSAIADAI